MKMKVFFHNTKLVNGSRIISLLFFVLFLAAGLSGFLNGYLNTAFNLNKMYDQWLPGLLTEKKLQDQVALHYF